MTACEVLTTGWCPLECKYCYIPKNEYMKEMHREIVESLKSGEFLDRLEAVFGDRLEYLGFWGTEPTLTLDILGEKLPEVFERFPKIKELSFSTNMMLDSRIIVRFVDKCRKLDRKLLLKVQVSLDGPPWITDENRQGGAAGVMEQKLFEIVHQLNRGNMRQLEVQFRWKPTHSIDNFKAFVGDTKLLHEYKEFFERLNKRFEDENTNEKVKLLGGSYTPTIVVPGKYTTEDGMVFAEYVKAVHREGFETSYSPRVMRLVRNQLELGKRRQFSCSGGDSNFGLGKTIQICHRTFYYDDEKYLSSVLEQADTENWDVSLFRRGTLDFINKWYIIDPKDELAKNRFMYVMRGYHDFWRLQMGYTNAMLMELAYAGQIDERYLHDAGLRELFALFLNASMSCPMENLLNTGSIHLQVVSLMRLFGNGAFQEVVRKVNQRIREKNIKIPEGTP